MAEPATKPAEKQPAASAEIVDVIAAHEMEARRYEGKQFSAMYYPQSWSEAAIHSAPAYFRKVPNFNATTACKRCKSTMSNMRVFPEEKYYCVPCLKLIGVGRPDGTPPENTHFPVEVLMNIFCCLQTYQDFAHCSMVCHQWLDAANYDQQAENQLTNVKRLLISREVYLQKQRNYSNPAVTEFCSKLRLGCLMGEWQEAVCKRRLELAIFIVHSDFYAKALNVQKLPRDDRTKYSTSASEKYLQWDAATSSEQLKDGSFRVMTKVMDEKTSVAVILDEATGKVVSYEHCSKKCACM